MSAAGREGPPVDRAPRRVGRVVVVTLVFTVGVQLGDAALHAVQEVADIGIARPLSYDRERPPRLTTSNMSLDVLADRVLGLFGLGPRKELAGDHEPYYPTRH